jgi:hypothetical protein
MHILMEVKALSFSGHFPDARRSRLIWCHVSSTLCLSSTFSLPVLPPSASSCFFWMDSDAHYELCNCLSFFLNKQKHGDVGSAWVCRPGLNERAMNLSFIIIIWGADAMYLSSTRMGVGPEPRAAGDGGMCRLTRAFPILMFN